MTLTRIVTANARMVGDVFELEIGVVALPDMLEEIQVETLGRTDAKSD